jgi:hypothetical protein
MILRINVSWDLRIKEAWLDLFERTYAREANLLLPLPDIDLSDAVALAVAHGLHVVDERLVGESDGYEIARNTLLNINTMQSGPPTQSTYVYEESIRNRLGSGVRSLGVYVAAKRSCSHFTVLHEWRAKRRALEGAKPAATDLLERHLLREIPLDGGIGKLNSDTHPALRKKGVNGSM